jgi:predicted GNAT family N-acyltransferase
MAIEVREALTEADRAAAMRIRFMVFVDEQQVPAELEPDEYDAVAIHLLAWDTETREAVGTARIVKKDGRIAKIGRVAVLLPGRGTGVGRALMLAAIERSQQEGLTSAILDAQVTVIPFYERLGFVAEGPIFDDAGIDHRRMTRPL